MAGPGRDTPLRTVLGNSATRFGTARGIDTVGELLDWLPRTYLDPQRPSAFTDLTHGDYVVVLGTVLEATTRSMRSRRGRMLNVVVGDDDGNRLTLTFFRPYGHEKALLPGKRVICAGTVDHYRGQVQLTHPDYVVIGLRSVDSPDPAAWLGEGLVPVYTVTPKLSSMVIARSVSLVLHAVEDLPDPVPLPVRDAHDLPSLLEAYRMVHQPADQGQRAQGMRRLRFGEAFVIQAALAQRRHAEDAVPAVPRRASADGLVAAFTDQLPFRLTEGQQEVLEQVDADLGREVPMHRLLQGEVGSGKTVVALLAMLTVVDSGGQAALLAPTEVLAAQHHRSITAMLGPLAEAGLLGGDPRATRVALLTGGQPASGRQQALLQATTGEAGIVIGTHALIQQHVRFDDLGLVVVDEQHRFGVEQRDALRAKAEEGRTPHVLVMTATPIPRTVAMTVYGDMEISTLRELPQGRLPIATHVVTGDRPPWVARTWARVAEEAQRGNQVYVVCPRIGDQEDPDLPGGAEVGPGGPIPSAREPGGEEGNEDPDQDDGPRLHGVHQVERALRALPATASLRIGVVHGRVPTEEKDATMRAFAAGDLDLLVATTVIEVGVDVPAATLMVVLDADRFGISQLHQLRGRVGRGSEAGLCLLMSQDPASPSAERLEAVAATSDGFELARVDLEARQEGDVLGANQSGGRSALRFLRLARDEKLIVAAHEDAWAVVGADPDLEVHPALREEIARLDAERAAFLERG